MWMFLGALFGVSLCWMIFSLEMFIYITEEATKTMKEFNKIIGE